VAIIEIQSVTKPSIGAADKAVAVALKETRPHWMRHPEHRARKDCLLLGRMAAARQRDQTLSTLLLPDSGQVRWWPRY